jgi:hypothetical protein
MTLQTGNVQFVVIVLAVVAMIAFETKRPAAGGALLAFAIGAKLYPGLLLVGLIFQRRFRELLWTVGFGLLYCVAVLVMAGPGPFVDFLSFQLPRLASGEAFAFFKQSQDATATNLSIYGIPYKLQLLGLVQSPDTLATILSRAYAVLLVALTVFIAWKGSKQPPPEDSNARAARPIQWLAILTLASLQSPFAPPYVMLGLTWLLTLWAPGGKHFARPALLFAAGWLCLTVIIPKHLTATLVSASIMQLAGLGSALTALLIHSRVQAPTHPSRGAP